MNSLALAVISAATALSGGTFPDVLELSTVPCSVTTALEVKLETEVKKSLPVRTDYSVDLRALTVTETVGDMSAVFRYGPDRKLREARTQGRRSSTQRTVDYDDHGEVLSTTLIKAENGKPNAVERIDYTKRPDGLFEYTVSKCQGCIAVQVQKSRLVRPVVDPQGVVTAVRTYLYRNGGLNEDQYSEERYERNRAGDLITIHHADGHVNHKRSYWSGSRAEDRAVGRYVTSESVLKDSNLVAEQVQTFDPFGRAIETVLTRHGPARVTTRVTTDYSCR